MPFRRTSSRRTQHRRVARSRRLNTYAVRRPRYQTGNSYMNTFGRQLKTLQPNKMKAVLRFAINEGDVHGIASTTGSIVDYVYRANGMYDPYASAGGQQPRGFDQYMALYRNFTVIGSKIFVRFVFKDNNAAAGTNNMMKVGIALQDGSSSMASQIALSEAARASTKIITSGTGPVRITKTFSPRKFFSKPSVLTDDALSGTAAADPSEQAYFHVAGYALNSESSTCYMDGWIDYIAVFHSPIAPSAS